MITERKIEEAIAVLENPNASAEARKDALWVADLYVQQENAAAAEIEALSLRRRVAAA